MGKWAQTAALPQAGVFTLIVYVHRICETHMFASWMGEHPQWYVFTLETEKNNLLFQLD